jgi:regulator of nucleoside diphosphate kinase
LIYPEDRMWPDAEISVLTPLGMALLGRSAGDRVLLDAEAGEPAKLVSIESVGPRMRDGIVATGRRRADSGRSADPA